MHFISFYFQEKISDSLVGFSFDMILKVEEQMTIFGFALVLDSRKFYCLVNSGIRRLDFIALVRP